MDDWLEAMIEAMLVVVGLLSITPLFVAFILIRKASEPIIALKWIKHIQRNHDQLIVYARKNRYLLPNQYADEDQTVFICTIPAADPKEYLIWVLDRHGNSIPAMWNNYCHNDRSIVDHLYEYEYIDRFSTIWDPNIIKIPRFVQRRLQELSEEDFVLAKLCCESELLDDQHG